MRNFTFKGLFLEVVFIVLGSLSIQAADGDLITKQITIKLEEAGTLPSKIGDTKKYKITNLKIMGEINGTDLRFIREMAGCDYKGMGTEGKLVTLDLSEAKIVKGGDYYYHGYYFGDFLAQVRKSVDSPPGMLTEDHHHTVHEESQVCYSSHLRPKSLHL